MRFLVPLFVVLAVAAFHSALSASLQYSEKEEDVTTDYDGLTQLQKIDQMEFEAAQKTKAAQMNISGNLNEDSRYLEAVKDGSVEERDKDESKEEAAESNGAAEEESESSEETVGRERRDHKETVTESSFDEKTQLSTQQQDE